MPLSRILWLLIMKYDDDWMFITGRQHLLLASIQSNIGNPEKILCKQLQEEYWFNNIYLPWKTKKK